MHFKEEVTSETELAGQCSLLRCSMFNIQTLGAWSDFVRCAKSPGKILISAILIMQ